MASILIMRLFSKYIAPYLRVQASLSLLLFACFQPTLHAAELEKVQLLVRELRNDQGQIIPVKDDIRQLFLYFEREAHVSFEVRYYPMARLINNVKNGEGIAFGLSKNSERLEILQFSDFIYANYVWLVTPRTSQFNFNTIDDLKGKTVGVIRGVSYGDEFDQRKNDSFKVEEDTASHVARLKKLAMRRMDVMLFGARQADPNEVHALLRHMQSVDKSHVLDASEIDFVVLAKPLRIDELHFASALNQHTDLIKRLNTAIARGKKSGEILRILNPAK